MPCRCRPEDVDEMPGGFRVQGLGFRASGLGLGVWGYCLGIGLWGGLGHLPEKELHARHPKPKLWV